MFSLSIRWGWRTDNPVRGIEKYHEEKRYRWLSNAKWSEIDFEKGVWVKPSHHIKQKRTERLPLSSTALQLLSAMQEAEFTSEYLFPGKNPEKPLYDLKRFWRSIMLSLDIQDYRIHDNRHTHASQLVSSGMSLAIVDRLLGHTNPITTQRYAYLADDPLREAAEIIAAKMR